MASRNIEPVILMQFGGRLALEAVGGGRCKGSLLGWLPDYVFFKGSADLARQYIAVFIVAGAFPGVPCIGRFPLNPQGFVGVTAQRLLPQGTQGNKSQEVARGELKKPHTERFPVQPALAPGRRCFWFLVFSPSVSCSLSATHFVVFPGDFYDSWIDLVSGGASRYIH